MNGVEFFKKNWNLIICIILMIISSVIMFFYIDKKEGFHEDEIFSYTASNSKYSNILITYAKLDNLDTIMKTPNIIESVKNLIYYNIINPDEYKQKLDTLGEERNVSIWKTREDAIETMQIDSPQEVFDLFTVYWNTARDVHPPLFYFLVHIVSCFFYNSFSKYIIFIINLAFFIATLVFLRKIMKFLNKENLAIPLLILYGFSVGAISTVMFQRMYMMLTFFTVCFLYINLKIYYNNFKLDKKLKTQLCVTTILGFLTQYYFCIYAAFLALIMIILMIVKKNKLEIKPYILQFVKSAIIGILVFSPCIYHIFFSYRGAGGDGNNYTFWQIACSFIKNIFNGYSLETYLGIAISVVLIIVLIVEIVKSQENRELYALLVAPVILNFLVICKLSPYKSLRYVMNILPIVAIIAICLIDNLIKNKKISFICLTLIACVLSAWGLATNKVKYLYVGYNEYLEVAKNYSEDRFVLICQTSFNHIQDIPEMKIYKESIIIDTPNLDELKDNKELQESDEFILSIKNWIGDTNEILNTVLENTGFSNYELLLNSENSAKCSVYKITK